jgi:molybdopterin-containing oxidoreductase family membrane subunit
MTLAASVICASILAWEFQMRPVEGWHSSIFAPFVSLTSILSGLAAAALLSLLLPNPTGMTRAVHTPDTREKAGKFMLAFCILSFYFWWCEFLTTWYGAIPSETRVMAARYTGPLTPFLVVVLSAFPVIPLLILGSKRVRQRPPVLGAATVLILAAVLADRFVNLAPAVVGHEVNGALAILRIMPVDVLIVIAPVFLLMGLGILAARAVPWASQWEIRLASEFEQPDRFAGVPVTRVLRHPPIG